MLLIADMDERASGLRESRFTGVTDLRTFLEQKLHSYGHKRKFRPLDIFSGHYPETVLVKDMEKREADYRLRLMIKSEYGNDPQKVELLSVGIAWVPEEKGFPLLIKSYAVGKFPDDLRILPPEDQWSRHPYYVRLDYRQVRQGIEEITDWLTQAKLI